jgi:hypothetical protein
VGLWSTWFRRSGWTKIFRDHAEQQEKDELLESAAVNVLGLAVTGIHVECQ